MKSVGLSRIPHFTFNITWSYQYRDSQYEIKLQNSIHSTYLPLIGVTLNKLRPQFRRDVARSQSLTPHVCMRREQNAGVKCGRCFNSKGNTFFFTSSLYLLLSACQQTWINAGVRGFFMVKQNTSTRTFHLTNEWLSIWKDFLIDALFSRLPSWEYAYGSLDQTTNRSKALSYLRLNAIKSRPYPQMWT